jgi:Site-specific recombinase XerD
MGMKQVTPGLWRLDINAKVQGKQFRKREDFSGNRRAAVERCFEIKKELRAYAEVENRSLKSSETTNFGQALEWYYRVKKENLVSPSSFERMKSDLGNVRLTEIGRRFKEYWLCLRRTRSRQTGDFLSPSTVNHYTIMAKAALNMCVKDGLIENNPLRHIEILKVVPRDIYLSELDRQRLLNVIDREASHLSAIVRFAFSVPARKAELVNLRREDLDLINNAIRVRHGNAKGDNGSWKPIQPGWLTEYFQNLPKETDYLFYRHGRKGEYKPLNNFRRAWTRCLRIAGIPDFHFHDTRHISASDLLNAGNPEQLVCQIAGWKSGNMIKQYYHKDGLRAVQNVVFSGEKVDAPGRLLQIAVS